MFNSNFASHPFFAVILQPMSVCSPLLKNNRFLLASYFSVFLFWASLSLFLFTPGLAAVWNLIGHDVAMLACYGTEALGSHPAIGKEESNSEWFFIIIWEPFCRTVTNFRKKWKHHIFFNRTSGPIFMLFLSDLHIFYQQNR